MSVKVVMVSQAPTETHFLPSPPRSLWVTLDKRPCAFLAYLWACPHFCWLSLSSVTCHRLLGGRYHSILLPQQLGTLQLHQNSPATTPRWFFCLSSFSWSWDIWVFSNRAHVTSAAEQKPRTPHTSSTSKPLSQYAHGEKSHNGLSVSTCVNMHVLVVCVWRS